MSSIKEIVLKTGLSQSTVMRVLKGSTNVNDVTLLQRYLAGDAEFDKLQMFYSDINRDGKTNVKDVTDLQQAITK